jgi:hypothetical protein
MSIMQSKARALAAIGAVVFAGTVASAQVVVGGTGFITVSVATVGAVGGGMSGDARLPVTASGARMDPTSNRVQISASGRRGVIRRIEIEVPNARAGQRIELTPASGASIRITLDGNQTLGADTRGFVQFDSLAGGRGAGRYEGTFQHGAAPIVVRGQFSVTFSPGVGAPAGGANPGPGPTPGPVGGGATSADAGRR